MEHQVKLILAGVAAASAVALAVFLTETGPPPAPANVAHPVPSPPPVTGSPGAPLIGRQQAPRLAPEPAAGRPLDCLSGVIDETTAICGKGDMAARLALVERLAALGPGAEEMLAAALQTVRTRAERGVLADAMARIGTSEAVDSLFGVLNATTDPALRTEVLRSFDALPPGQAIETLASGLTLPLDPQIHDRVIATVARTADASTVQFLHEMYREPDAYGGQSERVLAALGSIDNDGATPSVVGLLRSSREAPVMAAAVNSLGKIGSPEALQAIADSISALGDTNPGLRQRFLNVIGSVNNPGARAWLQKASASASDRGLAQAASSALRLLHSQARQEIQ